MQRHLQAALLKEGQQRQQTPLRQAHQIRQLAAERQLRQMRRRRDHYVGRVADALLAVARQPVVGGEEAHHLAQHRRGDQPAVAPRSLGVLNHHVGDEARGIDRQHPDDRGDQVLVGVTPLCRIEHLRGAGLGAEPVALDARQPGGALFGHRLHHPQNCRGHFRRQHRAQRLARKRPHHGAVRGDDPVDQLRAQQHAAVGERRCRLHDLQRRHRNLLANGNRGLGAGRPLLHRAQQAGALAAQRGAGGLAKAEGAQHAVEVVGVDPVRGVGGAGVAGVAQDVLGGDVAVYAEVADADDAAIGEGAAVVAGAGEGHGGADRPGLQQRGDGKDLEHRPRLVHVGGDGVAPALARKGGVVVGIEPRLRRVAEDFAAVGGGHDDKDGVRVMLPVGGAGDLLHRVLDVDVDGQEQAVAEHAGAVGGDGVGRQHVVEGVFEALQADVVHPHESEERGGQRAFRVGAGLFRLEVDALQLAALVSGANLGGLLGAHVAADKGEAAGLQALPYLAGAGTEDRRKLLRRLLGRGDGRVPGGHRVALQGNGQHAPVAVQDRAALHLRQAHRGLLGRELDPGHKGAVAPQERQHAEAEERDEQIQPPHDRVTPRPRRRGIYGGAVTRMVAAMGTHIAKYRPQCPRCRGNPATTGNQPATDLGGTRRGSSLH